MPQTKSEIAAMLESAGLAANKRLGQHFLIDGNLMRRVVETAEIEPNAVVLEVGVGTGSLTEELLRHAAHVVAVEIDRGLARLVAERLGGEDKLTLLHTDVLETKSRTSGEVLAAVTDACERTGGPALLVANLPYQIASPLLVDLALSDLPLTRMCFSVQREVAGRILAHPNSKDYGPLSIVLQAAGVPRRIAALPRQAFWPAPAIESTLVRIDLHPDHPARRDDLGRLNVLAKACFLHRRKTLGHNLRRAFPEAAARLGSTEHWDLSRRPEDVTVEEWVALSGELRHALATPDEQ